MITLFCRARARRTQERRVHAHPRDHIGLFCIYSRSLVGLFASIVGLTPGTSCVSTPPLSPPFFGPHKHTHSLSLSLSLSLTYTHQPTHPPTIYMCIFTYKDPEIFSGWSRGPITMSLRPEVCAVSPHLLSASMMMPLRILFYTKRQYQCCRRYAL